MLDLAYNSFAVITKTKMNLCIRANERISCETVDPITATRNLLMILRHGQEPNSLLRKPSRKPFTHQMETLIWLGCK